MHGRAKEDRAAELAAYHNEYLDSLIKNEPDLRRLAQLEKLIKEKKERLEKRIHQDRHDNFELQLSDWLKKNEISPAQKEVILNIVDKSSSYDDLAPVFAKKMKTYFDEQGISPAALGQAFLSKLRMLFEIAYALDATQRVTPEPVTDIQKLKNEIKDLESRAKPLNLMLESEFESLRELWSPDSKEFEAVLPALELLAAQASGPKKKVELLLVADIGIDPDLLGVIQMRAAASREKGNVLVVMGYESYEALMKKEPKPVLKGITKLSFLHHGGHIREDLSSQLFVDYTPHVGTFARQMPDLKDIVLRGCGTADPVKAEEEKKKEQPVAAGRLHNLKIVAAGKNIENLQLQGDVILLQQKSLAEGKIETLVKYRDKTTQRPMTKKLENIHLVKSDKELSLDELRAISDSADQTPLKLHQEKSREFSLKAFFDPDRRMTKEERTSAKQYILRARTEPTADFGQDATLIGKRVRDSLLAAKCQNITVKAYIGGYGPGQERAIPFKSHQYEKQPKALRAVVDSSSATASDAAVTDEKEKEKEKPIKRDLI